jgi:circadian clock protein KaiC
VGYCDPATSSMQWGYLRREHHPIGQGAICRSWPRRYPQCRSSPESPLSDARSPGSGKTTLGLQFLFEGANAGEKGLYITLSETEQEMRESAASHNWSIPENIDIFELVPPESLLDEKQEQSLLYSSDLELGETTNRIFEAMERSKPSRVVLDSLSEIRLLAQNSLRYRRQILALKHYFAQRDVTVLLLDDLTPDVLDKTVHSVTRARRLCRGDWP